MYKNYTSLVVGRDTQLGKGEKSNSTGTKWLLSLVFLFGMLFIGFNSNAQTNLISPTGVGGFESGSTLTANGWTGVGSVQSWFVGTSAVTAPSLGTNMAYISIASGAWTQGNATPSVAHIYRNITIPAGETFLTVTLKYKTKNVDATFDYLKVHLVPQTTTPVGGTELATGQLGVNTDGTTSYATYTFSGTVATGAQRLVLSFKKDGVAPNGAAAIDEISVTSSAPPAAPANDTCANATALPCGTSNLAGTTVSSVSETAPNGLSSPYGVWYSFTGDGVSTTISVAPNTLDIALGIFSASACGATYTTVADVDSISASATETFTFTSTLGTKYFVYIAYYDPAGSTTGGFTISRTCTPTITTSVSSLSSFTHTVGTPSAQQTYTVSGAALTAGVVVTVPANYEISTTSGTFTPGNTSVTLAQSGGALTGQPVSVYVRLNASAAGTYNGNITHTSTGATTKNVAVTGTATPATVFDLSVTALTVPTISSCYTASESVTFQITNSGNQLWDFTTKPRTISGTITNGSTSSFGPISLTGTLAAGATTTITVATLTNMRTPQTFTFTGTLNNANESGPGSGTANDSFSVARTSTNPTVSLSSNSPVCSGLALTLTATASGGNNSIPATFSGSATPGTAIPDNSLTGRSSTIAITGSGNVTSTTAIDITLSIPHTFSGDIDAYLVGPGNCGALELSTDNGSTTDGYSNLILHTTGAYLNVTTLPTLTAPTPNSGNYLTEGSVLVAPNTISGTLGGTYLAANVPVVALNGCPINGTWKLFVGDDANLDTGTLGSWSLSIAGTAPDGNFTDVFSGTGTIGSVAYSGANNSTAIVSVTNPTTSSYSVIATDANGCASLPATTAVTVNPLPTPTITGALAFCSGDSTILDAGAGYSTYNWSNGATTQSISVNTAGTFSVTVTNANGCSGISPTVSTTVYSLPTPTISGNLAFCSGDSTILDAGAGYSSYSWSNGATTQTTSVNTAGTFSVTVTNANGCSGISPTVSTTVYSLPTPTISGTLSFCSGDSTILDAGAGYSGYSWSNGATTQTTSVNTAGTFSVTVTNANGCSGISPTVSTTVIPLPATPTISADDSTTFCSGGSVVLTSSEGDNYLWSNGATTQSITVTASGNYSVSIISSFGCASAPSAAATVTVTPQPLWYLDADDDLYYTGAPIASCTPPGLSYTTATLLGGGDCADSNPDINPGITEVCYNNIDDNCSVTLSEGCAPVPVNMNASYNNTTLASLSIAIPAVPYSYLSETNLKYRFTVTNTTTGASVSDIIQTSRFVTIPGSLYSSPGTYTIVASAVINEEVVPYQGNSITVFGPTIPKITLAPISCGATLASLTSTLTASQGQNATGYIFRIRAVDGAVYATSPSSTRFVNANSFAGFPLSYATSYLVSVQYTYNDPVTSAPLESGYGAECTITTPSIPTTTIASPTCGGTVAALNAGISAAAAPYATGYQFRIRLTSNVGGPYIEAAPVASRFSSLTGFGTLQYNSSYSISVRYSVVNNSVTSWSNYGAECIVNTPNLPTTQLVPSQCGQTAATTLTQQLNIVAYPGFPNYRVKLTEQIGEDLGASQEITTSYSYFRLNQFSIAQNGKEYNVEVAIKQGSVFGPYSTVCDIHTPEITKTVKMPFKAVAYPNPFANNFMLDVKTTSQSAVNLKVYDMVGRLIEQRDVRVSDLETATIGDRYPSGIYNVVVSQEESIQTVRVVKR